jgi:succinate dehydrogenase/fumarate reductase flavoprotein subunit
MHSMLPRSSDVVVVGAGNAAFCAALAAAEHNVSVLVLERSPEEEAGIPDCIRTGRAAAAKVVNPPT